ncbi:MAG: ATP-binding protein [Spirochaetales bacterium]|nr:MAG: ATP-binding protein [Spirochaetales bacterium]
MSENTYLNDIHEIRVDENNPLFDKTGLLYKEFPSDYRQIRYFTLLIVQSAPLEIKEINLLEQQISEVIKNAVKHGNHSDPARKVRVWYSFDSTHAHLIVQDEGEGFRDLEVWNAFNRKRLEILAEQDFEKLADYVSFRTQKSDDNDGGNALFAALEYWNGGFFFNNKRNAVAMLKKFPQKKHAIA